MTEVDADVAVVGYGPVGNALAILLAQLGRTVMVLERWPEPYPLPRSVHFDHEVGRILQSCGIGDEMRKISEPAEVYEWRNAAGRTLLRFGQVGDGSSGWPASSMFNQPMAEALLDRRATELGVDLRRSTPIRRGHPTTRGSSSSTRTPPSSSVSGTRSPTRRSRCCARKRDAIPTTDTCQT
jgi:2-polyprenyl-6-methoxyphenol hydroxylase-like FAD-dependent oxidoreductase